MEWRPQVKAQSVHHDEFICCRVFLWLHTQLQPLEVLIELLDEVARVLVHAAVDLNLLEAHANARGQVSASIVFAHQLSLNESFK